MALNILNNLFQKHKNEELKQAIEENDLDKIIALLADGAQVGAADVCNCVIDKKNAALAGRLITACPNINEYDENGLTPLLSFVFAAATDKNRIPFSIINACEPNEKLSGIIKTCARLGADVNAPYLCTPEELESYPYTPDFYKCTALHIAAGSGDLASVKALMKAGADVNAQSATGSTPLMWAVRNNKTDVALELINNRAAVNYQINGERLKKTRESARKMTPLLVAALHGATDCIKLLINKGATLLSKDTRGHGALHFAAMAADVDGMRFLLNHNESADQKNHFGRTALFCLMGALTEENVDKIIEGVELLVKKGADINAQDNSGNTPLKAFAFYAQRKGLRCPGNAFKKMFYALMALGADVNAQDMNGETILHRVNSLFAFNFYHKNGADINIKNKEGKTPLEVLPMPLKTQVKRLLKEQISAEPKSDAVQQLFAAYTQMDDFEKEQFKEMILNDSINAKIKTSIKKVHLPQDRQAERA